jgi:hypothetical protein
MHAELHLADAFTGTPFYGNTAAVCVLKEPADPAGMQKVAAKMKHSETSLLSQFLTAGTSVGLPSSGSGSLRSCDSCLCFHALEERVT